MSAELDHRSYFLGTGGSLAFTLNMNAALKRRFHVL